MTIESANITERRDIKTTAGTVANEFLCFYNIEAAGHIRLCAIVSKRQVIFIENNHLSESGIGVESIDEHPKSGMFTPDTP